MLKGRYLETAYFDEYINKPGSQMVVFYGQKFLGKTSFILDYCKERTYSYYLVHAYAKEWMLQQLHNVVESLSQKESDGKKVLIIDEFQSFAKNEEFMPMLIDYMKTEDVLVVLVSSEVNWVETSMVKSFGRSVTAINGFYKCKELSFQSICQLYPDYNRANLFIMYSIFGGIPGLWNFFDDNLNVEENVVQNILSEQCYLRHSGYAYSMTGLRESSVYDTILMCMASGNTKLNDLYKLTGFSRAKISVYLKTLMEQEQINKIYSIDCVGHDNSQKGIYDISNHFTLFWFRFVYQYEDQLQLLGAQQFYDTYVKDKILDFCGKYLKDIAKEYFTLQGKIPAASKNTPDCFLGKKNQINLVWKQKAVYHVVMCDRIKIMTTYEDFEKLVLAADEAKMREREFYVISFRNFDEKLTFEARMKKNVHLISFAQMLESF